jgi:hypothetical protein
MNTIPKVIKELDKSHQEFGLDSLTFQIVMQDLKLQLREYCEKNGIKEVVGK